MIASSCEENDLHHPLMDESKETITNDCEFRSSREFPFTKKMNHALKLLRHKNRPNPLVPLKAHTSKSKIGRTKADFMKHIPDVI